MNRYPYTHTHIHGNESNRKINNKYILDGFSFLSILLSFNINNYYRIVLCNSDLLDYLEVEKFGYFLSLRKHSPACKVAIVVYVIGRYKSKR